MKDIYQEAGNELGELVGRSLSDDDSLALMFIVRSGTVRLPSGLVVGIDVGEGVGDRDCAVMIATLLGDDDVLMWKTNVWAAKDRGAVVRMLGLLESKGVHVLWSNTSALVALVEGTRMAVKRVLEYRFGRLSNDHFRSVLEASDQRLIAMANAILDAQSIDDVLESKPTE